MLCGMATNETNRFTAALGVVVCVECRRLSDRYWSGWRAYRVDDPELDEPPALGFYCPACAEAEFGPHR
jgi:hypothetical protein